MQGQQQGAHNFRELRRGEGASAEQMDWLKNWEKRHAAYFTAMTLQPACRTCWIGNGESKQYPYKVSDM
eukprot:1159008-Pelagomonas_calceolata.AAC.6